MELVSRLRQRRAHPDAGRRVRLPEQVARIYDAVQELEAKYKGRKFTPDGHLVGSLGEAIATEAFGLELLPASSPIHDAVDTATGQFVQIKLTAGHSIGMNCEAERLLVFRIVSPIEAEVVYYGPGAPAWHAAHKPGKNGQRVISLVKLRALAQ